MKYLFLFTALVWCSLTFSQRYLFQSYSTSEGLTQSQVTSICQDSTGYLWIGTLGGVSKYNGNTFQNYSTDNGLLNNRVNVVVWIDSKVFIGHQGGISVIDNNKITAISLARPFQMTNVTDIVKYNGRIIVATNGAGLYELKNRTLTALPLLRHDYAFVRDMLEWKGDLYFATRGGMVRSNNLLKSDFFLKDREISISALAVRNNYLLISSFYDGLLYYSKEKNAIVKTKFENDGHLFNDIIVDSRNYIWICTSNGIIKFNEKESFFFDNKVGLPLNITSTAYEDADQNIWIGTQGKGLVKAANGDISFFDKSTGLLSDLVLSGFQSSDGVYYFGTMDGGVIKTTDFKSFTSIPINPTVWCAVGNVDGYHWFGTKFGLYSVDKADRFKLYDLDDGAPGFKITAFHKIDSKSMYIGGSHGIVRYSEGKFTPVGTNVSDIGTIRNITYFKGVLFVATDMGLYSLGKNNRFELTGQLNRTVYSIAKINSERLFVGTEDGLYELVGSNEMKRVRYSSDVASNYINFLNVVGSDLLVGTNNGVYIIDTKKQEKNVKRIGVSDGLIDPETNLNSSFIDRTGALWFGTASGLVHLNLKTLNRQTQRARLKLNNILLNYEPFDYKSYDGEMVKGIPQNMQFPYNKNNLQFNLDGVSLNNYEDLSFQFKIEGLDDTWMPPSKAPYITLSGLSAGNYIVHVRTLLDDGSTVDQLAIAFTIKQAFYKTWWFISLVALFVSIVIFLFMRMQLKREQEKNELERTEFKARLITLEQQSLNASMNRHFIFNSLNSIQYFINISDRLSANKYLSNFAKLIRKNLDSSTEENSMVTLAEEIERIELYLSLEAMRFNGKFDYHIHTNGVDLESVLIPAMMIQPFVENSIIHGMLPQTDRKGKINIEIKQEGNYLSISILDNGIGIEKSIEQKTGFSGDHKSQGMEITMKRIDIMKKISDRDMELIGPQQLYDSSGNILGTAVKIKISLNNLED